MAEAFSEGTGALPDRWRVVCLGDVAAVNRCQWDPTDGSPIFYLDLAAIIAPGRLSPPKELAAKDAPSRARRRVQAGDVLVSTVRPYLRGFARVPEAPHNLVASTGFAVLTPRPEVVGSLIYHHVMAPQFASHLEASMTGQAYPAVRPSDVASYAILLPPLPEQRAIAAVLDAIDDAIERAEAVVAATERLRDALLHELLTRGVPGWHAAWRDVPGVGVVPASWEVVRLGDVAEVRNGTTPSRARLDYWQGDAVPFAKTGQVNDLFITEPDEFITSQAVTAGAVVVPKGSVLIAMIGQGKTRGMAARLGFDAAINQNFAAVYRTGEDFRLEFFFAWARHNYSVIRALGQGSNQDALNCALVEGMRVPKPPVAEQRAIATMLDSLDGAIERDRTETGVLRSLKASTADALLTGRVRVGLTFGQGVAK